MKKYPKYIVMPVALLIYFLFMAIYSIRRNDGRMPDNFLVICAVEVVILVVLFFSLRYLYNKRR